jgi:hypothetical protein
MADDMRNTNNPYCPPNTPAAGASTGSATQNTSNLGETPRTDDDADIKRETDIRNSGIRDTAAPGEGPASSFGTTSTTETTTVHRTEVPGERVRDDKEFDANRDPITGAPGSHPVGTGIGAAAAGTAGAFIGSMAGPVGTAIGAVVGAVAGGLAGKGVAEAIDPTAEDAYWREEYRNRPYYDATHDYDTDYGPAYTYGYTSYDKHRGRKYEEVESDLESGWDKAKGKSRLGWEKAKHATRDAWHRVERAMPGDADRDGR